MYIRVIFISQRYAYNKIYTNIYQYLPNVYLISINKSII